MSLDRFGERAVQAISELKKGRRKEAFVVHHDDADGLASGVITSLCLEREGYTVKRFCLEKVYPEVIESIHAKKGRVIFYSDIGSAHADLISKCNASKNLTIILDHHDPIEAMDPRVFDLNLEHFGFRGEADFSGATCCYLFAKTLNGKNKDLAYLALVGSSEIPQGFLGINKAVLDEALKNGVVKVVGKKVEVIKFGIAVNALFSALQILGPVGYYTRGPELGIKACLEGITPEIKRELDKLESKRKEANKKLLSKLYRERLKETEHIQWFDAEDTYAGMGTKVIGTFCSFLLYQTRVVKPDKYIVGITNMSAEIPGWGELKASLVKASARVPKELQKLIEQGKMPSAVELLREASKGFGVADGHEFAANVIVATSMKQTLIENLERTVKSFRH